MNFLEEQYECLVFLDAIASLDLGYECPWSLSHFPSVTVIRCYRIYSLEFTPNIINYLKGCFSTWTAHTCNKDYFLFFLIYKKLVPFTVTIVHFIFSTCIIFGLTIVIIIVTFLICLIINIILGGHCVKFEMRENIMINLNVKFV